MSQIIYGARLNPARDAYETAPVADTRDGIFIAQREGWSIFPTEAGAIAYAEAQVAAQASGAFDPYPAPPPGRH